MLNIFSLSKKFSVAILFEFNLKFVPLFAGSRFKDAFQDPGAYLAIEHLFEVHSFEKEIN